MKREDILIEVIDRLYAAASDDAHWSAASEAMREVLGADLIFLQYRPTPADMEVVSTNIDASILQAAGDWARQDPFFAAARNRPARRGYLGDELVPDKLLQRTEYYHECLRGLLDSRDFMGSMITAPFGAIGLFRSADMPPFDGQGRDLLSMLTPHYERALSIRERLRLADARMGTGYAVLEALTLPIFIVTCDGVVAFLNRAAQNILSRNDGVELAGLAHRRLLQARDAESNRRLQLALRATADPQQCELPDLIQLRRTTQQTPYIATISPLPPRYGEPTSGHTRVLLVTLSDPDARPAVTAHSLRRLYGLTATEASVAIALAAGTSPAEISARNEVSLYTTKAHMRRIFEKTGTRRQSEVMRLVLNCQAVNIELDGLS